MFEMILKGIWLEDFSDLEDQDEENEFHRKQYRDIEVEQELLFD